MLLATLINHDNSDLLVANAARVSMGKHHAEFDAGEHPGSDTRLLRYLARENHWTPYAHPQLAFHREVPLQEALTWMAHRTPGCETLITEMDKHTATLIERGSLWYWANPKNRALMNGVHHTTVESIIVRDFPQASSALGVRPPPRITADTIYPLSLGSLCDAWVAQDPWSRARLPTLTFRVTAPFPIRTQAYKHKYGFVENEISARYVSEPLGVFVPDAWRSAPQNVKQGSGAALDAAAQIRANTIYASVAQHADQARQTLIEMGVAPEQVRFINLQGTLTQWYWTASLDALIRMVNQRLDRHAQGEIRMLAEQIAPVLWERFPETMERLL